MPGLTRRRNPDALQKSFIMNRERSSIAFIQGPFDR